VEVNRTTLGPLGREDVKELLTETLLSGDESQTEEAGRKVEALAAPAGFGAGLTSESVEDTRPPVVEEAEKAVSASTGGGTCDASSAVANDEPAVSDGGAVGFGAGIS
ncbi:MAG: hypothetical protein IIC51_04420, partial [Planctomycetes bacterium]|nr:hypothetical protein [Planctomycetota bacterium]